VSRTLVLSCLLVLLLPAAARAEDAEITSFDGTRIVLHHFTAEGVAPGAQAPTVLFGPGYSSGGDTNPGSQSSEAIGNVGVGTLRRAGYHVVTWDPRGFGKSGGTVQVDSPEHEARDVQAILDWVARRPDALLDGPGDPRVGMQGASYGGGIQLTTAQRDGRIDAIVPVIAWHSLLTSLFKDQSLKAGWGLVLCGGGESRGLAEGILQPRPETGGHDPVITRTCTNGIATGQVPPPEDQAWFAARGPAELVRRIRIPTLLVQGTVDTLFTLQEAIDNHAILRANGVPLKMLWFCGGHGACTTGSGEAGHVERAIIAWLDRHVKRDARVDTGPAFEWLADDARWRSARGYPLPERGALRGQGTGTLALQPATQSGGAVAATPVPPGGAVEVITEPAREDADVLGAPTLRMTYRGTAVPAQTWVWAQVVTEDRRRVAGNLVTPIPVTLDGQERTVERRLEPVALRAAKGTRYRVQLVPSSTLYYPQKAAGAVTVVRAEAALPVADPAAVGPAGTAGPRPGAQAGPGATPPRTAARRCGRGFRTIAVRPRGRGVRIAVRRRVARPWRLEAFRAPRTSGPLGRRLSRRAGRPRMAFAGRPGRRYLLRFTMRLADGRADVRRVAVRRAGGRWRVVALRGRCGHDLGRRPQRRAQVR